MSNLSRLLLSAMVAVALLTAAQAIEGAPPSFNEFLVNSTGNGDDSNTADNICSTGTMIGTPPVAECTLRAALQQANITPNLLSQDRIFFSIPAPGFVDAGCVAGLCTIAPPAASIFPPSFPTQPSALSFPAIVQPLIIDGYTQPGASANTNTPAMGGSNAVLRISIKGPDNNVPMTAPQSAAFGILAGGGSATAGGGSTIRGLNIYGFFGNMTQACPSAVNIYASDNNAVEGNFIGTSPDGTTAVGFGNRNLAAVCIYGSQNNTIGGLTPMTRNLISANGTAGVTFRVPSSTFSPPLTPRAVTGNKVQGNLIGTNAAGTVRLSSPYLATLQSNTNGVFFSTSTGATQSNNLIGGTQMEARNVISGNFSGIEVAGSGTTANTVQGNYIGTNVSGNAAIPNHNAGMLVQNSSATTIGGAAAGAGNVIAGNGPGGLTFLRGIDFFNSHNNVVQGNKIGVGADGTTAIGNLKAGIAIEVANNNRIGGINAGEGNIIANQIAEPPATADSGIGVHVISGTGNTILGNSIFNNANLGIDLGVVGPTQGNGPTANDAAPDADTGPNNLQNFPVITAATSNGAATTVTGTLTSALSTNYRIEFFSNASCDLPGNHGEGQTFLGSTNVLTDGSGNAVINAVLPVGTSAGRVITSTATRLDGTLAPVETSEFSFCGSPASSVTFVASGTIEVRKSLAPAGDGGLFNLQIDGVTMTPVGGVGNNGTSGPVPVGTGTHSVAETPAGTTVLSNYWTSISCRSGGGTGPVVASGPGPSLSNVNVGNLEQIVCVISNMRIPPQCTAAGVTTVTGTPGNDVLMISQNGTVFVDALAGNDSIIVTGAATLCVNGGEGNDTVVGRNGNDVIFGGNGNDNLRGGGGNDTIGGGGGNDSALGEAGNDGLYGADGDDSLNGNDGTDTTDGGPGTDNCSAETESDCEL